MKSRRPIIRSPRRRAVATRWALRDRAALENLTGVDADLTNRIRRARSVAHQPADVGKCASGIGRRYPVARRERRKLHGPGAEKRVGIDEECVGAVAHHGGEGRLDLAAGAGDPWCVTRHGRSASVVMAVSGR